MSDRVLLCGAWDEGAGYPRTRSLRQGLEAAGIEAHELKRLFLHQANINMNTFVAKKVLGRDPIENEAPIIRDEFADTASAGSIIAFHKHHQDMVSGDKAIICSFGAGYSAGCFIIEHV